MHQEKEYTLVFCRRENPESPGSRQVLLGMKKRGFGVGRWNGYGGKIEEGESTEVGALRELEEESTIHSAVLNRRGYLVFYMAEDDKYMKVHVYDTWNFSGEAIETEEMRPRWFCEDELPFDDMWPDDSYWLGQMLSDTRSFIGRFDFEDNDTITDHTLKFS